MQHPRKHFDLFFYIKQRQQKGIHHKKKVNFFKVTVKVLFTHILKLN